VGTGHAGEPLDDEGGPHYRWRPEQQPRQAQARQGRFRQDSRHLDAAHPRIPPAAVVVATVGGREEPTWGTAEDVVSEEAAASAGVCKANRI
jgi:hypothetical protein